MRHTFLGLGSVGALVGVVMMIVGVKSREMNVALVGYGALIGLVSSLIAFVARIFIGQRG